jgi:hypothetical protein
MGIMMGILGFCVFVGIGGVDILGLALLCLWILRGKR